MSARLPKLDCVCRCARPEFAACTPETVRAALRRTRTLASLNLPLTLRSVSSCFAWWRQTAATDETLGPVVGEVVNGRVRFI
jgi:hypothetical protein